MIKLLFNEGGQPCYIDDLKLLQENSNKMSAALLDVIGGKNKAMLLQPVTKTVESVNTDLSTTYVIGDGTLILEGGLIPFKGKKLTVHRGNTIFVCIKRTETDVRTFADGQERPCREQFTASLSFVTTGAYKFFPLDEIPTFLDCLGKSVGTAILPESISVIFANGYYGRFGMKKVDESDWEFTLDIDTKEQEWNPSAPGYKGMLFSVEDDAVERLLHGKKTPVFTAFGKSYYLTFGNGSPCCILNPNGVGDIYQPSVDIPLLRIAYSWKLSEMKNF